MDTQNESDNKAAAPADSQEDKKTGNDTEDVRTEPAEETSEADKEIEAREHPNEEENPLDPADSKDSK